MEIQISIDQEEFKEKPSKKQAGIISSRIGGEGQYMELSKIAAAVGGRGRTFCPAIFFNNKRRADMFGGMQLFTLDFDGGVSYKEVQERAARYGLPICFSYYTFSSERGKEKFRVCFLHKCWVKEKEAAEIMIGMLMKIFPECDRQCSDVSRMFYGGKGVIEQGEGTFDIVQLAINFQMCLRQREESQYKRNLETFAKRYHILVKNSSLAIFNALSVCEEGEENVDFRGHNYYTLIGEDEKPTFCDDFYVIERYHQDIGRECTKAQMEAMGESYRGKSKKEYKIKNMEEKAGRCRLLSNFLEGLDIGHGGRFHIAMNLLHIRGGKRLFLNTIEKYGFDLLKWKETFGYAKDNDYSPQGCCKCIYWEICRNKGNLFSILKEDTDRRVLVTKERKYVSLAEGERRLLENIHRAVASLEPGIHLIRAQTALGKTEAACKVICENTDTRFIMALPTTKLKEEVYGRLKGMGVKAVMTASIDTPGFPEEVSCRVHACYDMGIPNTERVIQNYLKERNDDESIGTLLCRQYLKNKEELDEARVILTTHSRLLTFKKEFLEQFTVIVDEDILQAYMFNQVIGVSTDALWKACRKSSLEILKDRAEAILEAPENTYGSLKPILGIGGALFMNEDEIDALGLDGENVNDLLRAAAFIKHQDGTVNYFCPSKLQPGKYIVLSATLSETMYRLYFKNMDIISYGQPLVEYTGRLEQYTYHSLGRADLEDKYGKILEFVETLGGMDWEIITFKKYAEGTNYEGLYYGNQAGCDKLKGKNLVIIGTPYTVDDRYKLVAHYLGVDANRKEDFRPHRQRIEYNGYSFQHTTYKNELLREIQAYSISSELEQAVGRARLLREECTVLLFSSFPCEQARIHEKDYLAMGGINLK